MRRLSQISGLLAAIIGVAACNNAPAPVSTENRVVRSPSPPAVVHSVRYRGETLSLISHWYTGQADNWKKISQANTQVKPNHLKFGDRISIPGQLVKREDEFPKDFISPKGRKKLLAERQISSDSTYASLAAAPISESPNQKRANTKSSLKKSAIRETEMSDAAPSRLAPYTKTAFLDEPKPQPPVIRAVNLKLARASLTTPTAPRRNSKTIDSGVTAKKSYAAISSPATAKTASSRSTSSAKTSALKTARPKIAAKKADVSGENLITPSPAIEEIDSSVEARKAREKAAPVEVIAEDTTPNEALAETTASNGSRQPRFYSCAGDSCAVHRLD